MSNKTTHCDVLKNIGLLSIKINLKISLKIPSEVENVVLSFILLVEEHSWEAIPLSTQKQNKKFTCLLNIREEDARKNWVVSRHPKDKILYSRASGHFSKLLRQLRNSFFKKYMLNLNGTVSRLSCSPVLSRNSTTCVKPNNSVLTTFWTNEDVMLELVKFKKQYWSEYMWKANN